MPPEHLLLDAFQAQIKGRTPARQEAGGRPGHAGGVTSPFEVPQGEVEGAWRGKGSLNCCARPAATAILTRIIST